MNYYKPLSGALRISERSNINQISTHLQQNTDIVKNLEESVRDELPEMINEVIKTSGSENHNVRKLKNDIVTLVNDNGIEGTAFLSKAKDILVRLNALIPQNSTSIRMIRILKSILKSI